MEYKDNDDLIKLKVISMVRDIIYNFGIKLSMDIKHIGLTITSSGYKVDRYGKIISSGWSLSQL